MPRDGMGWARCMCAWDVWDMDWRWGLEVLLPVVVRKRQISVIGVVPSSRFWSRNVSRSRTMDLESSICNYIAKLDQIRLILFELNLGGECQKIQIRS